MEQSPTCLAPLLHTQPVPAGGPVVSTTKCSEPLHCLPVPGVRLRAPTSSPTPHSIRGFTASHNCRPGVLRNRVRQRTMPTLPGLASPRKQDGGSPSPASVPLQAETHLYVHPSHVHSQPWSRPVSLRPPPLRALCEAEVQLYNLWLWVGTGFRLFSLKG